MIDEIRTPPSEPLFAAEPSLRMRKLLRHVAPAEVPASEDIVSTEALEDSLNILAEPPLSLIAVGDIMLGGRAKAVVAKQGAACLFDAVRPILQHAFIVLGNLEGPFARRAPRIQRNHCYRVDPECALALRQAGFTVLTLANNHLLDCGRAGVLETLDALVGAGVASVGAGVNEEAARGPVIQQAGRWRVGLLGYYWNRRCAATVDLAGAAVGSPDALAMDIGRLRGQVDRVVVTFHWGVPYVREPSLEDRAIARFAVDCGADVVVGHHPHIVQPFEIYHGRPIFYSVGNFSFGSRNSRAEGLLLGFQFDDRQTLVNVYPIYVKNRDPRVDFQPKVLTGQSAHRVLCRLIEISAGSGSALKIGQGRGTLSLPWSSERGQKAHAVYA